MIILTDYSDFGEIFIGKYSPELLNVVYILNGICTEQFLIDFESDILISKAPFLSYDAKKQSFFRYILHYFVSDDGVCVALHLVSLAGTTMSHLVTGFVVDKNGLNQPVESCNRHLMVTIFVVLVNCWNLMD